MKWKLGPGVIYPPAACSCKRWGAGAVVQRVGGHDETAQSYKSRAYPVSPGRFTHHQASALGGSLTDSIKAHQAVMSKVSNSSASAARARICLPMCECVLASSRKNLVFKKVVGFQFLGGGDYLSHPKKIESLISSP